MNKRYFTYLLTNKYCNVLYTGVTNNLIRRVHEHKTKFQKGFTQKYKIDRLVYFEMYEDINDAIGREKQIKGWTRKKKNNLINTLNLLWKDLYRELNCI